MAAKHPNLTVGPEGFPAVRLECFPAWNPTPPPCRHHDHHHPSLVYPVHSWTMAEDREEWEAFNLAFPESSLSHSLNFFLVSFIPQQVMSRSETDQKQVGWEKKGFFPIILWGLSPKCIILQNPNVIPILGFGNVGIHTHTNPYAYT